MEDFKFVMEGEKLDELSMEDIKGGITSMGEDCCKVNNECNENVTCNCNSNDDEDDKGGSSEEPCPPNGYWA